MCIVHYFFDGKMVSSLRSPAYESAFVTAHLEVPGDMFSLAHERQIKNQGVVGSTSGILNFILKKSEEFSQKSQKKYK